MGNERFKLEISPSPTHDQYCIVDTEQDILTIYGDLGCIYFTSAPQLCELLNNLDKENKSLKKENKKLKKTIKLNQQY